MNLEHYQALYIGYAAAMAGWFLALRIRPNVWPLTAPRFPQPWREIGYVLLAALAVLGIGQIHTNVYHLPNGGRWGPALESVNQAVIFSPLFVLLWLRGHGLDTIWLPKKSVPIRLLAGAVLSLIALFAFTLTKSGLGAFPSVLREVYTVAHSRQLAQVFFEDVAIAMMMVRFTAALRSPWLAAIIVGLLFAGGHIPTMISEGVNAKEFTGLIFDFVLATGIVRVLQRAADIWWFWPVHFTMDMTQFV